jgi:hypothetical protein
MDKPKKHSGRGDLHKALSHPLRASILADIQEYGQVSPNQFSTRHKISLNLTAYHFGVLDKYAAITLVETKPRRGATEHFYGINPGSPVPDLVRATQLLQNMKADPAVALDQGELGGEGSSVVIVPINLDGRGQTELQQLMSSIRTGVSEVAERCRRRLSKSTGSQPIPVRVGLATYTPSPKGTAPPIAG